MLGLFSNLLDRPTIRYAIAFTLGASLGATGAHAMITGFFHAIGTMVGTHHIPKPTLKP